MTEPLPAQPVQPAQPAARKRPFALYALVALMVLKVVLIVAATVGTNRLRANDSLIIEALRIPGLARAVEEVSILEPILTVIAAILLLSIGGLLAGRRWGWLLAMVITGLFVAVDILAFAAGSVNYLWMVLNIVTVFYLNQREIRDNLRGSGSPSSAVDQSGPGPTA